MKEKCKTSNRRKQNLFAMIIRLKAWNFIAVCLVLCPIFCLSQDTMPVKPAAYRSGVEASYTRSWRAEVPVSSANALINMGLREVKQVTEYFDGLGRPIQTVAKQGSFPTARTSVDMVSPFVYDEQGREARKYLPFAASDTSGNKGASDGDSNLIRLINNSVFIVILSAY